MAFWNVIIAINENLQIDNILRVLNTYFHREFSIKPLHFNIMTNNFIK